MINDSTPRTFACVGGMGWEPKKHSRIAYSGLVPISPYTTPNAVNVSGRRRVVGPVVCEATRGAADAGAERESDNHLHYRVLFS